MAMFLNTSDTSFFLEELIKNTSKLLILISPCLKLNDRLKQLLEDKNRLKININIIYGKSYLHPEDINWIQKLDCIRLNYCKNLNAKCYLNENECIISSQNLYELSQSNNNEMGILIHKLEDNEIFKEAYKEAQRILHISNEVKFTLNQIGAEFNFPHLKQSDDFDTITKLTTSKLAAKYNAKTHEVLEKFNEKGLLSLNSNHKYHLTTLGKAHGGEFKSSQYGGYFIWPENMQI